MPTHKLDSPHGEIDALCVVSHEMVVIEFLQACLDDEVDAKILSNLSPQFLEALNIVAIHSTCSRGLFECLDRRHLAAKDH